ncbi:MAG TPA: glycoside hydrolase family 31 protein, partial [Clostridia bacterium]|nr:glycoside hydrolase family 31 protein [Clostridia bacterium]
MLIQDGLRIVRTFDAETLWIEPWGKNGLRVRATVEEAMPRHNWALLDPEPARGVKLQVQGDAGRIENGTIRATLSASGKLCFFNQRDELLLEEFVRDMDQPDFTSHMRLRPRAFEGIMGGAYRVAQRFESDPSEKLFGMGQYQHGVFNLKGTHLELIQRNSQASVPFLMSSKGYAMLWNNPAMGHANLGTNLTEWTAQSSNIIDYWITAGDTPAQMEETYAAVTGTVPMMPEYAMGFWQCKLRYATQRELLSVAREYKRRGLPLSVIVIDFFHWTRHGDWKFDPEAWPDPEGMVRELKSMGIETAVSIWPTVEARSENYREMLEKGFLTRVDAGPRLSMESKNWTIFFDASQAAARKYVWEKAKKGYYDAGIRTFWLDVAEPQYNSGFGLYRYKAGSQLSVGNAYPLWYAQGFYDGMRESGETEILSLSRCAWAGCQRYGALVWSGDIHSSFRSMRYQVYAGLNMAIAGIPWWTTDIGGFDCGDIRDNDFRELLVRWFQWGTFCPVM